MPIGARADTPCRVSDVHLKIVRHVPREVNLAERGTPVRIMVVGPRIGGQSLSERKRSRLMQALEQRLPGTDFDIVDEGGAALPVAQGFEAMRDEIAAAKPDLVLWQVGTPDALNHADPELLGRKLVQAAEWLRGQSIELILIDPPFVPNVGHEKLYARVVGKIDQITTDWSINLVRRYAATQQFNQSRNPRDGQQDAHMSSSRCLPQLIAEAVQRVVSR